MMYAVTPYWNDEKTLEKAVRSALEHVDRVVLVGGAWQGMPGAPADGSSTDGSDDIARALAKELPREVRLIGPRLWKHQMEQRNAALISRKKADWVLLLDADEVLHAKNLALDHAVDHATALGLRALGIQRRAIGDPMTHTQTRLINMHGFGGWTAGGHHVVKVDGRERLLHVWDPAIPGVEIEDVGLRYRPGKRLEAKALYDGTDRGGERLDLQRVPNAEIARTCEAVGQQVHAGQIPGRGFVWVLQQAVLRLRQCQCPARIAGEAPILPEELRGGA